MSYLQNHFSHGGHEKIQFPKGLLSSSYEDNHGNNRPNDRFGLNNKAELLDAYQVYSYFYFKAYEQKR